ncbi:hypothetical protein BJX63DRAFT_429586 [Aspergillus granulosus]|uniref:Uncharacterized protein n=1 Tax=Aspergillus granulosus TaxID=176169 RepID=A0ABR4HPZ2_9EURO
MINCTFYLIALATGTGTQEYISSLYHKGASKHEILVTGIPHGWIHKPLQQDAARLTNHNWDLLLITKGSLGSLIAAKDHTITAFITADFGMPQQQYQRLVLRKDKDSAAGNSSNHPVQLPAEWADPDTDSLRIPARYIVEPYDDPFKAGILRLQPSMVDFLSNALPKEVQNKAVSLFNLFKYTNGDSSVHDQYMRDFEEGFGDSAGAYVKLMGPLQSQLRGTEESMGETSVEGLGWQDVDLVQYDTIYHYAYMLSTDLYQKLNVDKVKGLEDTCILVVSETKIM